jgi:hypothetical protein
MFHERSKADKLTLTRMTAPTMTDTITATNFATYVHMNVLFCLSLLANKHSVTPAPVLFTVTALTTETDVYSVINTITETLVSVL